eukprot:m.134601 g.134601  ORF g.134601 m.134601 type:complete len:86 (+) comp29747_c1_seq1:1617-1874(+)
MQLASLQTSRPEFDTAKQKQNNLQAKTKTTIRSLTNFHTSISHKTNFSQCCKTIFRNLFLNDPAHTSFSSCPHSPLVALGCDYGI